MSDDGRVRALHAEGLSIRQIAAEVGLSRSTVHRMVSAVVPAAPEAVSPADSTDFPGGHESGELLTSLLTADALVLLGVSEADLAGLRGDELTAYRMLGRVNTAEARKARERLHGRAWAEWLVRDAGGMVEQAWLGPGGPVPKSARDARIVELARSGWRQVDIAADVGMTQGAVSEALKRIAMELQREPLAGPRLHRRPGPSEDW